MKAKHKTLLLLIGPLFIAFASCKKSSVVPSKGKFLVLSAFEEQKATADNVFSLRLFNQLNTANTTNANVFASPISVSFALGMTSNGANGTTLNAFKNTLNFSGLAQDQVNAYYNNLITNLPQLEPNTTLKIANSIWYKKELTVLPQFTATSSKYFHAEVQGLDFSNASSTGTINDWVNNVTNGKIPSIVNKINPDDVMYLINAIYFKSSWAEKFNTSNTKKQDFHKADGSTVQTDFMNGSLDFNYYRDPELTAVELPYANDVFSMVLVMPGENKTLKELTTSLDSTKWNAITRSLAHIKGEVSLPKFTFSYNTSLKDPLINMGLGLAFSNDADLSGINGAKGLKVTDVIHKAFIAVDENGTTAAAATSVAVGITAAPVYNFTLDHPFVFAIREKHSGLILFIGTMNNPN